jgi:thiol-disulfide isomerase/thioredoxin
MTGRVIDIERLGYLVYKFHVEVDQEWLKENKVADLPTILIFDKGVEVKRFVGIVDTKDIVKGVKTKRQQQEQDFRLW